MPRIFAIDWDRHEVRGLVLNTGPTGTSVSGAWVAPFDLPEGSSPTAQQVGARLATAMGERTAGKATTIIGVGRDHVQMKLLTLPPAPADELPELVRFQAEREFTALGDDAALDFIPLAGDAQTPHQVLAVALSPAGLAEAREVSQLLDVEPNRVVLRACASASLVDRAGVVADDMVALVVAPLTDEADITVLADGHVVLMRTVRLPDAGQPDARQRTLISEIRRTVASVRQQLGERQVDQVLICGGSGDAAQISAVGGELDIPVSAFDPAAHAPAGLELQGISAASLPRFAAVLGMALGEADRRAPVVDFINVRRRVAARRFSRLHALAAATAAVLLLGLVFHFWRQATAPARELAIIREEIKGMQPFITKAEEMTAKAGAVERWLATDVTWLDGLTRLSERLRPKLLAEKDFPQSEDLVAQQLTLYRPTTSDPAAGRIDLRAVAKNDAAVAALERRLRDPKHQVSTGGLGRDQTIPGYESAFSLQVGVMPPLDEEAR